MATPLTDGINALTAYANEVTGASDTNLSDAVYTLAQGYGSGGDSTEYITLPDNTLTNTSNIDTYFAELIEGWDTEIIMLLVDISDGTLSANEFIGCWSQYTYSNYSSFSQVWRATQSVTRNDWVLITTTGRKYYVIRFGTSFR